MRRTTGTSGTGGLQEISRISLDLVAPALSWSAHCPAIKLLNVHAQLVTGRIERDLRRDTIVPRTDATHIHTTKARMMFTCIHVVSRTSIFFVGFPPSLLLLLLPLLAALWYHTRTTRPNNRFGWSCVFSRGDDGLSRCVEVGNVRKDYRKS